MFNLSLEIPTENTRVKSVYTTGSPCSTSDPERSPSSDMETIPEFVPLENDWMDTVMPGFAEDAFFRYMVPADAPQHNITDVSYNGEGNVYTSAAPPKLKRNRVNALDADISSGRVSVREHKNHLQDSLDVAIQSGRVSTRGFYPIDQAVASGHVQTRERPENPHIQSLIDCANITVRDKPEVAHLEALEMAIQNGHVNVRHT